MKKVTIADVAKEANVSVSTVSQFMNQRYEYMSVETRAKIQLAVEKLHYRPNILARSLKNKGTQTIGIIVANIMYTFTTHIVHHLERQFQQHGFQVIVCNANDNPQLEREHIDLLLAKQVEGFILFPTGNNKDLYDYLYNSNIPVVFLDRMIADVKIPSVLLNNEKAIDLAVGELLNKGYSNLAIVAGSIEQNITPRVERLEGFRKAMNSRGIAYVEHQVIATSAEKLPEKFNHLLTEVNLDGIIAGNDRMLLAILHYLKEHAPDFLAKIGIAVIDEMPLAKFMSTKLTTIEQPTEEMAKQAVHLFLQIKKSGYTEELLSAYRFDPTLV
ncbi:LacI family DNA-binding transcriptional regulator [Solibacillus silvestris]